MMRKEYRQSKIGGQITGRALHGAVGATLDFHLSSFQLILRVRRERATTPDLYISTEGGADSHRKSLSRMRTEETLFGDNLRKVKHEELANSPNEGS